jgi:trigger factor
MKIDRKNVSDTKVELKVVFDKMALDKTKQETVKRLSKNLSVPGFRSGKAPANMAEKNLDQSLLQREFLDDALNEVYGHIIEEENLRPISQPTVSVTKFVPFSDLELSIEVTVIGKVELADYKNIRLRQPEVKIADSDVDDVLKQLQAREAKRKSVERKSQLGDETIIDFDGIDPETKKPIPGSKSTNYALLLGSKSFIPGFEEHVVGLKPGEKTDFIITFPADYNAQFLRNKKVKFSVKLNQVNELKQPALDDKFAALVGPFKSIDELKEDIKRQITSERQIQNLRQYQNDLINKVVEQSKVNLPDKLIESEADRLEQEEKQRLIYDGRTWQEHLIEEGVDEEAHRERIVKQAAERVRAGVVIGEISREEGIQVSHEELDRQIKLLKGQYKDPQMQAELDKPDNQQDVANRLLTEKTIDRLAEYANKPN